MHRYCFNLLRGGTALAMAAWPFIIWFGLAKAQLYWLVWLLSGVLLLRLFWPGNNGMLKWIVQAGALGGVSLCLASYVLEMHRLLFFYPVCVNAVMLLVFGGSLRSSMPMVERLARLGGKDLPMAAIVYTRKVTQVWCVFFILNGGAALLTALWGDLEVWVFWNGMVAYLLMGLLMSGEWLVRHRLMARSER